MTLAPNSSSRETAVDFAYKNQKCNSKRLLIGLIKKSTVKCKKSLIDERIQLQFVKIYLSNEEMKKYDLILFIFYFFYCLFQVIKCFNAKCTFKFL